jgi:cytochrome c-type biogenesis protein CcmH/NrfF
VVLSEPPAKGGYLLAWILPGCLLGTGLILLVLWLAHQKKRERKTVSSLPAGLSPQDEEKFKKEWEKWNQS